MLKEKLTITADMKIREILKRFPETGKIFYKYKMDCLTCGGAEAEQLNLGVLYHGHDIKKLIYELNAAVKNSKKQK